MTQNSGTHVFKFLTPRKSSVEKIVKLHGFIQVHKPRNINVLFSQCGTFFAQLELPVYMLYVHVRLGSFFLDPEDIRVLGVGGHLEHC